MSDQATQIQPEVVVEATEADAPLGEGGKRALDAERQARRAAEAANRQPPRASTRGPRAATTH